MGFSKSMWFDMDGTIADLYGAESWLERLRAEEPGLFSELEPLVNPMEFSELCRDLVENGWTTLGIITWLPMNASDEYEAIVTEEKRIWAKKFTPYLTDFHALRYGTPKQYAPIKRAKAMILIDDNVEVCSMWDTPKMRTAINVDMVNDRRRMYEMIEVEIERYKED